jgi:ubiquinone/menaquinone biosynthesis C-methylase UbiE
MNQVINDRGCLSAKSLSRLALLVALLGLLTAGCTTLKLVAYEGFGRNRWQQPDRVVSSLGIRPGDHIADLGSGGGYFTFHLAGATGPEGKVYAVDVDQGLNKHVRQRAANEGYDNVEVILAKRDAPMLPQQAVDLLFICNTYHHLRDRIAYFNQFHEYLRPHGRVAIIDFDGRSWLEKLLGHSTPSEIIRAEMEAAGYELVQEYNYLPRQSFLVFTPGPRMGEIHQVP